MRTRKLTVGVVALCALSLLLWPSREARAQGEHGGADGGGAMGGGRPNWGYGLRAPLTANNGLSFDGLQAQATAAPDPSAQPLIGADGEYSRQAIMMEDYWLVVDEDWQNGLNGRLSPKFPKNYDAMDAQWPDTKDIGSWPVVARFQRNQVLSAVYGNRGILFATDGQRKTYILVRVDKDRVCFVRCQQKYVRPVKLNHDATNG